MQPAPAVEVVTRMPALEPRAADSHKGTFGRVLVVAGSRGMSGAAALCGAGALRAGAGLVQVAVPAGVLDVVAGLNPCYLTHPCPQDDRGRLAAGAEAELLELARQSDAVALGPGLGQSEAVAGVVFSLLAGIEAPLVLDADGINAIGPHADRLRARPRPLILTPHPGEFARLLGTSTASVQAARQDLAVRFAAEHGIVLLLKGHGTLVTDGRRLYHNTTGNPGMATGGTGDVLTGVIAAFLGQGLDPFEAAQFGAYVHGLAGDLARDDLGEASLIASDLLDYLPRVLHT